MINRQDPEQQGPTSEEPQSCIQSGIQTGTEILTVVIASGDKFKDKFDELNLYFEALTVQYKDVVQEVYNRTNIMIRSVNSQHLFTTTVKQIGNRVKFSNGHSTYFIRNLASRVTNGVDPLNKCYKAVIEVVDNGITYISNPDKSFFPNSLNGHQIVDKFFNVAANIKDIIGKNGGYWIEVKDSTSQVYRFFLRQDGNIDTFFPLM